MNHGTERSTPRLSPKAASIQGTPGVSILSCLHRFPQSWGWSQGSPANELVFTPAHMGGGGGCSGSPRDQNMLYRKSLPGMDWDRCQEGEWAGSWEHCYSEPGVTNCL